MGLDMYLSKRPTPFEKLVIELDLIVFKIKLRLEELGLVSRESILKHYETPTQYAAYWRKANHIHNWFVKNVQNGVDDCRAYPVSREQLQALVDLCKKVKSDRADGSNAVAVVELPRQEGFFFGDVEYDAYYDRDVEDTIKQLTPILESMKPGDVVEYQSSW